MPVTVEDQFLFRRDTMAAFVAAGVVPANGEPVVLTDPATGRFSAPLMGNGVDTVDKLPALSKGDKGDTGSQGLPGANGVATDDAVASNVGTAGTKTHTVSAAGEASQVTSIWVGQTANDGNIDITAARVYDIALVDASAPILV